ncbi:MAG: hypothetical protein R3E02_07645 [Blastomonas sp.]
MEHSKTIIEAIALRKCIMATYNRMRVKLAPHVLYTRHDDLFVDAVTLERDGQPPREAKLGQFKLAGLSAVGFADRGFEPADLLDLAEPRYDGTLLFAVE